MASPGVTRWHWQLRHGLRGVGPPGWVAAALVLAGVLGWGLGIEPMRDEARRLDADSAVLARRLAARGEAAPARATPRQQLVAFEQRFVGEAGIAGALASLQAAGRRRGVLLEQAEFRFSSEAGAPLSRYSIVLPVHADYPALRRFIRDALHELPGLALEEVSLRRGDPKAPALDAQLRFVLFVARRH